MLPLATLNCFNRDAIMDNPELTLADALVTTLYNWRRETLTVFLNLDNKHVVFLIEHELESQNSDVVIGRSGRTVVVCSLLKPLLSIYNQGPTLS